MVVGCPKCKAKLRVPDEKIKPEGSKFKCPKCRAMLLVRRPAKMAAPPPPPPKPSEIEPPPPPPSSLEKWMAARPEEERTARGPLQETPEPKGPPVSEQEPWPETPAKPESPPPPFPETPESKEPPASEHEPTAQMPPPPFEEPAPPPVEPVTEAPAPPGAPPEEKVEEKAEEKAPAPEAGPEAEASKILIAHPNPQTVNMLKFILMGANCTVISAQDGVDAMVQALKERPAAIVADVRLPKIHGVEMMKRLKNRAETKDIKIILTGAKAEAEVPPIEGVAGYIHQDRLQQGLVDLIKQALSAPPEAPPKTAPEMERPAPSAPKPAAPADAGVQRAQRFVRTVLSDIELYNKDKVVKSIRQGDFERVFAREIQEGRKLYEMRIPEEVRSKADFFEEAVQNFIEKKKKQLGI